MLRTQWKMTVERLLRASPRKRIQLDSRSIIAQQATVLDHPSPLVRALGGHDDFFMSFYEGVDIFVELYLKQQPDTNGIDFGRSRDLIRVIENHRKSSEKGAASEDTNKEDILDEDLDDLVL